MSNEILATLRDIIRINPLFQQVRRSRCRCAGETALSVTRPSRLRLFLLTLLHPQHVSYFARRFDVTNPYALADFAASLTTADAKELQVRPRARWRYGACRLC
jgi:hypothetical protein